MRKLRSLKQEFLRKWIKGLRKYNSEKKNMNLLERKKAIKLSADLAMASTRDKTTLWSQALLITNNNTSCSNMLTSSSSPKKKNRVIRKNSIVYRKSSRIRRCRKMFGGTSRERVGASVVIAKRLVEKRRRTLKSLLPGGELMDDDVCLVEETLDYIQSLTAQVEVMRCLVTASQLIINPP